MTHPLTSSEQELVGTGTFTQPPHSLHPFSKYLLRAHSMPGPALGGVGRSWGNDVENPSPSSTLPTPFTPFSVSSQQIRLSPFLPSFQGSLPIVSSPPPFSSSSVLVPPMRGKLTSVTLGGLGPSSALDPPSSFQPNQPWPTLSSPLPWALRV